MQQSRRAVLAGALAALWASVIGGCATGRSANAFYTYRVRLSIDGVPYEFTNGGRFGFSEALYGLGGGTAIVDYPFWSAVRLPSGEVALVRPPNMMWPVWVELERRKLDLPALPSLVTVPYATQQRPSVLIFDDASNPRRASGYLMPRAMERGSRITFLSNENEVVSSCDWTSVGETFPWYREFEKQFADICEAPSGAFFAAFPQTAAHRFDGSGGILPPFYAASATLRPTGPIKVSSKVIGLSDAFDGMLDRLSAGETVEAALELDKDGVLRFASEPRVLQFLALSEIDAALTNANVHLSSESPHSRAFKLFRRGLERSQDLRLGNLSFPGRHRDFRRQATEAPISFELTYPKRLMFPASPGAPGVPRSSSSGFPQPDFERLRLEHKFSEV